MRKKVATPPSSADRAIKAIDSDEGPRTVSATLSDTGKLVDANPNETYTKSVLAGQAIQIPFPRDYTKQVVTIDLISGEVVDNPAELILKDQTDTYYSHSFVKSVSQCSAAAYFRKTGAPKKLAFALERGSVAHAVIEEYIKHGTPVEPYFEFLWQRDIIDKKDRFLAKEVEKINQYEYFVTLRMCTEFVEENTELIAEGNTESEVEFSVVLELPVGDTFIKRRIFGKIDWIVWNAAHTKYHIFDFKGLALETPLVTPQGWTTMGEVRVGDQVFDKDGNVCNVIGKSKIHQKKCYRMTFDDKTSVICDHDHLWLTFSGEQKDEQSSVKTVEEIKATLKKCFGAGQSNHKITNAKPLNLPNLKLPIPPYTLGAWLGDGTASSGSIAKPDLEVFTNIEKDGFTVGDDISHRDNGCVKRTVYGLKTLLEDQRLVDNKFIPAIYMRASYQQRLDLLRGLMDTDGTYNKIRKQCVFVSTDKYLAAGVKELVLSLGARCQMWELQRNGFGKTVTCYDVVFTPVFFNPFALSRKAILVSPEPKTRAQRRNIFSIEEVEGVETQCIAVDSPSNTYLCGEQMLPTHNSSFAAPDQQELEEDVQFLLYQKAATEKYGFPPEKIWYYLLKGEHVCKATHIFKSGPRKGQSETSTPKFSNDHVRSIKCMDYAFEISVKPAEVLNQVLATYYLPTILEWESGLVRKRLDDRKACSRCMYKEHCDTVATLPLPRFIKLE